MTTALMAMVARLLFPAILTVAVAVLIKAHGAVGDGFAAGLIATLGVLVHYLAFGPAAVERRLPIRHAAPVAFAGLTLTLVVVAQSVVRSGTLLVHVPGEGSKPVEFGTLQLSTALAFEVGIFLLVMGGALTAIHALARLAEEVEG